MENRFQLVVFISILATVFVLIWFVLGGEPVAKKNTYIVSGVDDELLIPEDPRQVRRVVTSFSLDPSGSSNSGSDSSGYSSPSFPTFAGSESEAVSEEDPEELKQKLMFGFNPKFSNRIKRSPQPTLEQRKSKLRDEIMASGITNEAYINMMVLELDNERAESAKELAEAHITRNNPAMAIRVLQEELDATDSRNLMVRATLTSQISLIAAKFAFPDVLLESSSKLADLQSQILEIKRSTPQLMANPETREQLNSQHELFTSNRATLIDGNKAFVDMLIEHQGLPTEVKQIRNATFLNVEREGAIPFKSGELNRNTQNLDQEIQKAWSKPQYLR
ncbi:MAG: hypothetical protein H3C47_00830 [Candidatus Cloacimonetes bacterium]|nr:hypothetical protein [Candidatus Cloacimonadota bacterium]